MWWWWCPWQLPCKRKTWKSGHVSLYFLRTILATSFFRGKIGNSTIINSTEQAQNARHNSRIYLQCVSQNSVHASQADLWLVTSYPAPSSLIRLPQNLHMQIVYFYQLCNYDLYEISESQMQKAERKGNEKRLVISAVKVWWWLQVRRALEGARAMVGSRQMLSLLHSSIIVYCVSYLVLYLVWLAYQFLVHYIVPYLVWWDHDKAQTRILILYHTR